MSFMLKVELYSFTPSEFIITTLNHLTTHFPIYTFEMIKFQRFWKNRKSIFTFPHQLLNNHLVSLIFFFYCRILLFKEFQKIRVNKVMLHFVVKKKCKA